MKKKKKIIPYTYFSLRYFSKVLTDNNVEINQYKDIETWNKISVPIPSSDGLAARGGKLDLIGARRLVGEGCGKRPTRPDPLVIGVGNLGRAIQSTINLFKWTHSQFILFSLGEIK